MRKPRGLDLGASLLTSSCSLPETEAQTCKPAAQTNCVTGLVEPLDGQGQEEKDGASDRIQNGILHWLCKRASCVTEVGENQEIQWCPRSKHSCSLDATKT